MSAEMQEMFGRD